VSSLGGDGAHSLSGCFRKTKHRLLLTQNRNKFKIHGSVHLGKVYVGLKVQIDAHGFVCILYFTTFVLHVSGAICTHPQEHKLQSTAIGMCNSYGMLIHWSKYWHGQVRTEPELDRA
jgi:hypothetical protein